MYVLLEFLLGLTALGIVAVIGKIIMRILDKLGVAGVIGELLFGKERSDEEYD